MSEDQEHDGQEGGGVSPGPGAEQSAIVPVRASILDSDPPDRTGQRWDRRTRSFRQGAATPAG